MNPINPLWVIAAFAGAVAVIYALGRYLVQHADDEIDELLRYEAQQARKARR